MAKNRITHKLRTKRNLAEGWKTNLDAWFFDNTELLVFPNARLLAESGILEPGKKIVRGTMVSVERRLLTLGLIAVDTKNESTGVIWIRKMDSKIPYNPTWDDQRKLYGLDPDWRKQLTRVVRYNYSGIPFSLPDIIKESKIFNGGELPTGLALKAVKCHMHSIGFKVFRSADKSLQAWRGRWVKCDGNALGNHQHGIADEWCPHLFKAYGERKKPELKAAFLKDGWEELAKQYLANKKVETLVGFSTLTFIKHARLALHVDRLEDHDTALVEEFLKGSGYIKDCRKSKDTKVWVKAAKRHPGRSAALPAVAKLDDDYPINLDDLI